MFTGLVEGRGEVVFNHAIDGGHRLGIVPQVDMPLVPGESIAVNGVCLTLAGREGRALCFDLAPETLRDTTLGTCAPGFPVNLERAMSTEGRFGGHMVTGHVDTTAMVLEMCAEGESRWMRLGNFGMAPAAFLVPKGSLTVDGVSLTIQSADAQSAQFALIPHTLAVTTLSRLQEGSHVNIEFDYICRIVAHQLQWARQLNTEVCA